MSELLSNNYFHIIISTLVIYIFIVIAIRLFGKKELAQLSVVDMVFILLISNVVQNAMVGPDATLLGGLVAATTLFVANYIFKYLQYRFPKFGKIVEGDAILLIYEGKVIEPHLKKARITTDELMEAIREHGVATVEEINLAVMEVDGNISVLSKGYSNKTVKRRKTHKTISHVES
ncbi:MAG: DUF421 domain-containing protein [Paludibacter sp.]|nr:DUF421 domain-containing protein [Paludibacter sp.]